MKKIFTLTIFSLLVSWGNLTAQQENNLEAASMAVEQMLDEKGKASIQKFIDNHMHEQADEPAMVSKIVEIRKQLKGLRDGIGLDFDDDGAILALSAKGIEKRLRIAYDLNSQKVMDLYILPPEEKLNFDIDNLDAAVQFMIDQQMAGLVYFKKRGKVIINEPFGMANDKLAVPNGNETIFAIGSRPIDFTKAAILLLDQEGLLSLDDTIGVHLTDVPVDKQTITLKHLMSGESGLPDFFHNASDWDADLQWIDREEAIQRLLNQKLLFKPGQGNSHSHGAFGLLAAIVELKTGKSYIDYLNEKLFSPAGMTRTGEYGDKKDLAIADFATGGGPQFIGLPNIPPNWGPTSWLIKGSGGMYSTLGDLLRFYNYIREGDVFDADHKRYVKGASADLDGSDRGFELFSVYNPPDSELFLFLNRTGEQNMRRKIFRAFEALMD